MVNEVVDILSRAKDYFAVYGGHKGSMKDDSGNVCAMGAVRIINSNFQTIWVAEDLLCEVAEEQFSDRISTSGNTRDVSIARFNDHPDTTKEEVIAVFEKAIVKAQEVV